MPDQDKKVIWRNAVVRQILLNVNFCDDISTYKLEKNNRKIEITTGYSFSEIRLVPQELEGVCVVYTSGNVRPIWTYAARVGAGKISGQKCRASMFG